MKIRWQSNPGPQLAFLAAVADEVLYGGAVGGGKSDALLAWPLHRCHHPLHRSIILRRERKRLQELIDRARALYAEVDPKGYWHETELRWKWSSGAFTQFGYAEQEKDIEAFKSDEFDLILFDELTEFTEKQYKFMFMRCRSKVPEYAAWVRSATNPGGTGMDWVDKRFVGWQSDGSTLFQPYRVYTHENYVEGIGTVSRTRQYIPSTIFDNPKLPNREAYIASLADLDDDEREAYLHGRWGRWRGQFFKKLPREVEGKFKDSRWFIIRAMDYGVHDPTCILWLAVYPSLGVAEVIAEVYERHRTTDSLAEMIKGVELNLNIPAERIMASVLSPDAKKAGPDMGQSVMSLLNEKGAQFDPANNDRTAGWAQVRRLIARDILRVWEAQAPNLLRTLPRLPTDEKKRDDIKQIGVEDHAAEALRYAAMALYVTGFTPKGEETKEEGPPPKRDPNWDDVQKTLRGENKRDPWAMMF